MKSIDHRKGSEEHAVYSLNTFSNLFFNYKTPIKSIIGKTGGGGSSTILLDKRNSLENHLLKQSVYDSNGRNLFWSIKISGEILNKLKSNCLLEFSLCRCDFTSLYTTLPLNIIKEKLN